MYSFEVGDLVKIKDHDDPFRRIGIIVGFSPKKAHVKSHGLTVVVQVYWPSLDYTDWEYDFFLEKIQDDDLTDDNE
mgnify:CR=1 FL=1|tara:strand:- start:190 stop:417 length:228 start_codon:yes stop_codon:yes gene_type:complete